MASTASEDVGADDLSAEEVESDASNPQETFSPPPPMPSSPVSPPPGNLSATNVEEQDPTLADADDEEEEDEDYEQDFEDSDHFDGDAENDTIALNDETLGETQSSEPESGSAADSVHEDLLDASEGEGEDMLEDLQSPPAVASNDVHILSPQPTGPQGHASKEANADATFSNVTGMDDVDEQDDAESSWPIEGSEMIDLEGDQAATSNGILSEESGRVHIDDPEDLSSNQGLNDIAMDQTAIGHTEDLTSDQATESSKDSPSAEAVNLQDNSLFDQADEDTKDSPMGQITDSFLHSASKDALEDEQAIEELEDLPSDQGMEDFKSSLMHQVNLGINSEELSTDHATESPKDSPGVEAVDLLDGSLFDDQANEEPKDSPLGHITDSLLLSPSKVASEDDQAIGELEDLPSDRHMNDSRSSLMDQANLGNNTEELSSDQATEIPKGSPSAEAVDLHDDSSIDQADEDPKDSPSGHVTDYLPASPSKEASEDDQAVRELEGLPSDQGMADPEGSLTNQANLSNNTEELSSDHATEIPKGSPSAEAVDLQDRFLLVQADKPPKDSPMGQVTDSPLNAPSGQALDGLDESLNDESSRASKEINSGVNLGDSMREEGARMDAASSMEKIEDLEVDSERASGEQTAIMDDATSGGALSSETATDEANVGFTSMLDAYDAQHDADTMRSRLAEDETSGSSSEVLLPEPDQAKLPIGNGVESPSSEFGKSQSSLEISPSRDHASANELADTTSLHSSGARAELSTSKMEVGELEASSPGAMSENGRSPNIMSASSSSRLSDAFESGNDPLLPLDLEQLQSEARFSAGEMRSPFESMLAAEHVARGDRRKNKSFTSQSPESQSSSPRRTKGRFGHSGSLAGSRTSSPSRRPFAYSPAGRSRTRGDPPSSAASSPLSDVSDAQKKEIIAAVRAAVERTHSKLYDAFLVMDHTQKGCLNREELLRGLRALGLGLDDAVMREFAKSVDVNGDGVVTFQEFFRTFETSRIDPSKQTWTPPSPVKGSFFASVRSDEVESDEGVTKKEDDDEEDDDEEAPEKEEDGDGEGDGDDDWLVRKEDVKLASAMRSRIAHEDDDFDLIESWTKTPRRKANLRCAPSREVAYMSVLRVTIHQADLAASSDVCVRCSVGDEMQRTELEEATSHPVWNEDFIFGAHEEGLPPEGSLHVRLQCDPDVGPQEWDLPFWELLYFDETDVTVRDDEVSLRKWIDGPRHKLEISLVLGTEKMEDVRRLAALQAGPIDRAALWLDKAAIAEPLSFADSKSGAPLSPASTSSVSRRPALGPGSEKDQQMLETIEDLRAQISEMRESVTEEARRRQEAEERSAVSAKQMEDLEKQRQRDAERFQYQMREQQAREDEMRTEMQLLQMKQSSGVKADERVVKLEQSIRELYADLDQRNSEISNATEAAAAARMEREDWKARVEELQVQLRQTQARYRAKSMDSTEDARAEDTKSTGPATDGAEIDRLVDTIAKLNRVISELREAERRAQAQLRASEDRIREQTADLGQLASENEMQARKIASFEMDSRRQVAELRQAVAEKARLVKNLEEAEQQLAASDEAVAKARQERKDAEDRCVSMDARAELLQAQLSEAANKNLELSSELAEVRKLRAAQQRSTYLRPDAGLVCRHAKAQTRILRESVYRIRAEVEQMKDAAADVLAQWDSYVQLRRAKRQELASKPLTNTADLSLVRAKGMSQAEDPSTVNKRLGPVRAPVAPGQVSGLARRLRLERLRRRNLHKSRMGFGEKRVRRICSVFHTPAHVEDASSPSRSLAMTGDDAQTDDSLRVEPILASAEVMVQSDNSRRYFGFDEVVYVKDMAPSDADVLAADPRLGSQNGIRAQVSPIVDALFDGDRAVVASSGPASGATTNSIISAIFDVIGSLAANLKSEEKVDAAAVLPRVSISCVHIQNSRVFDLLASNEMETRSPLRHFPELSIDRAAARATGRIDLESAGLSVVEVKTRYEAALVASMGSGNHHNMLGSLPMARNTHTTGVEGSSSSETAFLLFTVWVEMGDDAYANEEEEGAFSADLVTGKMHILEVASTGRAAFADETMEGIVKVVNAMSHRQDLDAEGGSGASPGTLMRTFSSNVVLGILRDCLDEESLGIATRSEWPQRLEKSKTHYMTGDDEMGTYERDSCMFHLLVHPSLTVCNPRSSELLTALHFAQRIRTMPLSSPNLETSSFPASASPSSSSPGQLSRLQEAGTADRLAVRSPDRGPPPHVHSVPLAVLAASEEREVQDYRQQDTSNESVDNARNRPRTSHKPPMSKRRAKRASYSEQVRPRSRHRVREEDEEEEDEEGSEAEINDLVASLVAGQNVNLDALDALELEEHANLSKQFDALRTEVARSTPGGRSAKRRPASVSASNRRLRTPGSRSVTNRAREEGSRSHAVSSRKETGRRKSRRDPAAGTPRETERARHRVLEALLGQTEGMLHGLFLSMDTRRSGVLSRADFRRGMHRVDPSLSKRDLELFVDSMDSKRDGYIDFQEFFRVLGDAKTGNQHSLFLRDKRAEKIAMRERRRIRERLSPEAAAKAEWFPRQARQQPSGQRASSFDAEHTEEELRRFLGYRPPVRLDKILRQ